MLGCSRGGVCVVFAGGACVVFAGGHTWFLLGGRAWFLLGGMRGFCRGGRVWFFRGGCVGYDEIRSMSGRYASYWNAFLLPSANEVCEGYIFTRVCLSTGGCPGPGPGGGVSQHALRQTPPADGYCCGRYASYWNVFLLEFFLKKLNEPSIINQYILYNCLLC